MTTDLMSNFEQTSLEANQTEFTPVNTSTPTLDQVAIFTTALSRRNQSTSSWNTTGPGENATLVWEYNSESNASLTEDDCDCLPGFEKDIKMVLVAICCVGIIFNAMFNYVMVSNKSLHTPTFLYLCNLSIADMIFLITKLLNSLDVNIPCYAMEIFSYIPMLSSPVSILLVSSERYQAICNPLVSHQWRSNTITISLMAVTWLVAAAIDLPWMLMCVNLEFTQTALYFCVASFIFSLPYAISIVTVTIQYTLISINMSNRAKEISSTNLQSKFQQDRRRVVTMLMINTSVFYICTIPYITKLILDALTYIELTRASHSHAINTYLYFINHILLSINSSINPIIYTVGSAQCRQAIAVSFHSLFQLKKQCTSKKCLYDAKVEQNKTTKEMNSSMDVTNSSKLTTNSGMGTEEYTNPSDCTTNL